MLYYKNISVMGDAAMLWKRTMDPDSVFNAPRRDNQIISLSYKSDDEFIAGLQEALKEAARHAGYDLTVHDSMNSPSLQLEQVENARKRGAKAILINLVDPDSAPALLEAAGNMKVVFIAFVPADMRLLNENVVYVGADQKAAGRMQGEWLANHFKERGKNEIRYILLKGIRDRPITEQRTEAMLQALADNGIRAVAAAPPIYADLSRVQAMSQLLPVLSSGVKFDAIISNNDAMALGAIEAMEYLNMDPSRTVIVGIDATEPAVRALLEGKLAMTVYQNKTGRAITTITVVDNMLNRRAFSQGIEHLVSPENPYVVLYPYEPVTWYHIPRDLYF